ncbi:MAG TPA: hypothetical protein VII11_01680, partial [Bacteroidota bacterium]
MMKLKKNMKQFQHSVLTGLFLLSPLVMGQDGAMAKRTLAENDSTKTPVTFQQSIAPLLKANCSPCHYEGGQVVGKYPFEDYKTVGRSGKRGGSKLINWEVSMEQNAFNLWYLIIELAMLLVLTVSAALVLLQVFHIKRTRDIEFLHYFDEKLVTEKYSEGRRTIYNRIPNPAMDTEKKAHEGWITKRREDKG